ncbi:TraR/DksA family transcriptional regulator [Calditerrivibrio nitroreducens]|uniref:Transcriptional regulator, TraR/DksA family n=1 Tax=Calditerrivibrio nitroreducens (strain DSM 19672 / NBRC 101217 / Yu37-1) TaxID=768670 RepID=E4THT5_CALNY|nr:TraR/DksA family transcriptional regulator [Calditerrivibrio nitroreducens]ADR19946.1 transcriptional regulator, TraR/DksA family [Calditerrivibrio nitroreducens DSM 19672]
MDQNFLESQKQVLLKMREELRQKLKEKYAEAISFGTEDGQDSADEAYNLYNKNIMLGRVETDALKLNLVEQALKRIEEGTYGICIECGCDIEEKRLKQVPFARYCVDCKTELEKKGLIKM